MDSLTRIEHMTDQEVVAELLRHNPFGGYAPPNPGASFERQQKEQRVLRDTLARYRDEVTA
jgi:hypothetical protein